MKYYVRLDWLRDMIYYWTDKEDVRKVIQISFCEFRLLYKTNSLDLAIVYLVIDHRRPQSVVIFKSLIFA